MKLFFFVLFVSMISSCSRKDLKVRCTGNLTPCEPLQLEPSQLYKYHANSTSTVSFFIMIVYLIYRSKCIEKQFTVCIDKSITMPIRHMHRKRKRCLFCQPAIIIQPTQYQPKPVVKK